MEDLKTTVNAAVGDKLDAVGDKLGSVGDKLGAVGDRIQQAGESAAEKLRSARDQVVDASAKAVERGREAATAVDDFVHENPWQAMAIALAAGFAIGVLSTRGRR